MFNRTKAKEARRTRLIYQMLKDSKSITKALEKLRRNFPEAFRREKWTTHLK